MTIENLPNKRPHSSIKELQSCKKLLVGSGAVITALLGFDTYLAKLNETFGSHSEYIAPIAGLGFLAIMWSYIGSRVKIRNNEIRKLRSQLS